MATPLERHKCMQYFCIFLLSFQWHIFNFVRRVWTRKIGVNAITIIFYGEKRRKTLKRACLNVYSGARMSSQILVMYTFYVQYLSVLFKVLFSTSAFFQEKNFGPLWHKRFAKRPFFLFNVEYQISCSDIYKNRDTDFIIFRYFMF